MFRQAQPRFATVQITDDTLAFYVYSVTDEDTISSETISTRFFHCQNSNPNLKTLERKKCSPRREKLSTPKVDKTVHGPSRHSLTIWSTSATSSTQKNDWTRGKKPYCLLEKGTTKDEKATTQRLDPFRLQATNSHKVTSILDSTKNSATRPTASPFLENTFLLPRLLSCPA